MDPFTGTPFDPSGSTVLRICCRHGGSALGAGPKESCGVLGFRVLLKGSIGGSFKGIHIRFYDLEGLYRGLGFSGFRVFRVLGF